MTFDQAIELIGVHEGGYSVNPKDSGNWTGKVNASQLKGTKYGIAANSYPHLDIKNLTWEQAKSIYKQDFWNKYRIEELAPDIRFLTFDSIINHGPANGIKFLQRAIGVKDDGVLGAVTIAQSYKASPYKFAEIRSDFYVDIVTRNRSQMGFLKGWLRRNLASLQYTLTYK